MRKAKRVKKAATIAAVAYRAIIAGRSTNQVIAAVKAAFPKAKTSPFCVSYYRSALRRDGVKVPEPKRARGDA